LSFDPYLAVQQLNFPEIGRSLISLMEERYSKADLEEFRILIEGKLASAEQEYKNLKQSLTDSNDQSRSFDDFNELGGQADKEYIAQMMSRQARFIGDLQAALQRIANGTYGVCRVTGKLIDKGRLRAVPHTTQSMDAKNSQASKRA
jgi:RNA polymerase-binding transcription factor DksA